MRRLTDLADEAVPYVLHTQIRLAMEKVAEEWAKRMLQDEEFNRQVLEEAKRAFLDSIKHLKRKRDGRCRS